MQNKIENLGKLIRVGATATWPLAASGFSKSYFDAVPRGYYLYVLVDPRDDSVFYVGKGKGDRALQHDYAERRGLERNQLKAERIRQIRAAGYSIEVAVVCEGLSEKQALSLEDALIRSAWDVLTNIRPYQQSASDRLRAEVEWSLSVFDSVRGMPAPDGEDRREWDECVLIIERMAKSCRRILRRKLDEREVRRQERELREARQASRSIIDGLMAGVDTGLTDAELARALSV